MSQEASSVLRQVAAIATAQRSRSRARTLCPILGQARAFSLSYKRFKRNFKIFKSINDLKSFSFSVSTPFGPSKRALPEQSGTMLPIDDEGASDARIGDCEIPPTGSARQALKTSGSVFYNLQAPDLYREAILRGEAELSADGALVAYTGQHTGRSPKDKFIVRDENTDAVVWWDDNQPMAPAAFDALHADFIAHAAERDLFVQDLVGGADPAQSLPVRVVTELCLAFAVHPQPSDPAGRVRTRKLRAEHDDHRPAVLPRRSGAPRHALAKPSIAIDLTRMIVLIGGTAYAGEMKKAVFTALNYLLPSRGGHADALLGQCRAGRRRGDLLRPVGHRQDDAVGRSLAHADRRRRAWLGAGRHLQLRGRLLRQDASGSRAEAEPEIFAASIALRRGSGERRARRRDAKPGFRRRIEDRKHALAPIRCTSSPTPRRPAAPASRRTSSCSPPTLSASCRRSPS